MGRLDLLRSSLSRDRSWRRATLQFVVSVVVVTGLCGATLTSAGAAGPSLKASGSTSNKMGSDFTYVLSGTATASADHLVAWEQFNKVNGCASTYAGESTRELLQPTATYQLTLWTNVAVTGSYSVTAHFGASHLGVHGICAYLINLTTGQTYAQSGQFWTNHN